jgi:hypothetical protein
MFDNFCRLVWSQMPADYQIRVREIDLNATSLLFQDCGFDTISIENLFKQIHKLHDCVQLQKLDDVIFTYKHSDKLSEMTINDLFAVIFDCYLEDMSD